MQFKDIDGHEGLKNKLLQSIQRGRVSHAQLFHGPEGNGALLMAIAYAQYLACSRPGETDSCGSCSSCKQFLSFNYPDLHFVYPVAKTSKSSDKPKSLDFIREWAQLVEEEKYFSLFRWLEFLGIENKQAQISVYESADVLSQLSLKSYSGGYKFMIIWMPERMNNSAANKLLKIIEEPPAKTVFFLVSENAENLLQTITSRCQKTLIPKFKDADIENFLSAEQGLDLPSAKVAANLAGGNMARAIDLAKRAEAYKSYAIHFSTWVRSCFKADTHQIYNWVETVSKLEREKLKDFLYFCSSTLRESFGLNFIAPDHPNTVFGEIKFELEKFAPFVHLKNGRQLLELIDKASYDIGRNGNPKIILTDTSLKMARHLRIKP
ncbi:MAG: DNA polymerase III subunit delta' [Owenweeksia sp.]